MSRCCVSCVSSTPTHSIALIHFEHRKIAVEKHFHRLTVCALTRSIALSIEYDTIENTASIILPTQCISCIYIINCGNRCPSVAGAYIVGEPTNHHWYFIHKNKNVTHMNHSVTRNSKINWYNLNYRCSYTTSSLVEVLCSFAVSFQASMRAFAVSFVEDYLAPTLFCIHCECVLHETIRSCIYTYWLWRIPFSEKIMLADYRHSSFNVECIETNKAHIDHLLFELVNRFISGWFE